MDIVGLVSLWRRFTMPWIFNCIIPTSATQLRTRKKRLLPTFFTGNTKEGLLLHVDQLDRARLGYLNCFKPTKVNRSQKTTILGSECSRATFGLLFLKSIQTLWKLTSFNLEKESNAAFCERISWTDGLCAIWLLTWKDSAGLLGHGVRNRNPHPPCSYLVLVWTTRD